MLGAILGDIIGSRFEGDNHKSKKFALFDEECFATDDSIMTMALAKAIWECQGDKSALFDAAVRNMQNFGRKTPDAGYGGRFFQWLYEENPKPYNSWGNGAGMRVSPCGLVAKSLDEAQTLAETVTATTHSHPEGIKGGVSIASCIFLAKTGASKAEIRQFVEKNFYTLDFTCDEIRPTYQFSESCQMTNPVAIAAFLESADWEDAIRLAVSVGGDTDTICAMTGAIAEAFYGLPEPLLAKAQEFCPPEMLCFVEALEVLHNDFPIEKALKETRKLLKK